MLAKVLEKKKCASADMVTTKERWITDVYVCHCLVIHMQETLIVLDYFDFFPPFFFFNSDF